MENYETLMKKSDLACLRAIEFCQLGDLTMSAFWKNASIGFKEKAINLR